MTDTHNLWRPHVTVAALAERDGRFLMVEEEADGTLVYNQPAGHLDEGESLLTAVARETLEETAWCFEPQALVGIYRWRHPRNGVTYLRFCFSGVCRDHDPHRALDTGIRRALWLSLSDLVNAAERLRSPLVLRCIQDYLAGVRHPLELLIDVNGR